MRANIPALQPEDVEALLRTGVAAARSGQRERARDLLTRVVEQDEENIPAWLWLSGVVDSLDDREVCLENVLTLDPSNDAARNGLALVRQQKVDRLLREGIAAAKSGQHERARDLLTRVVEQDEENVPAWLWLSGVVDSLDDREVCLGNVLALDPDNDAAGRGLALVRKQKGTRVPSPVKVDTVSPAVPEPRPSSPFLSAEADIYSPAAPEPGPFPSPPSSEFDFGNEYLCPYCAAPTEPQDRKCRACGGKLWIHFRKREKRSKWLWVVLFLQASNTIQSARIPLMLSSIMFGAGSGELVALVDVYAELFGVSGAAVEIGIRVAFVAYLLLFLLSLTVLIALYLRWKPAFYLYLVNAALGLLVIIVSIVLFLLSPGMASLGGAGYVCSGLAVLLALAMLGLALQIRDDFLFEKERFLFRIDPDIISSSMILARGHEYANRKMWALAALHMRRVVVSMPDRMDGRVALILTYIRLKRHDLATQALAEARRISPDDPHVRELQTLLDDIRPTDSPPQRT